MDTPPRRSRRFAGPSAASIAVLVALLAAAPAPAKTPPREGTVYLHSAARGELEGGRLTLRGVARRLTWAHHYGNVTDQLNLLCNNEYHVTNPNIGIDATSVTPSFSVDAPGSCG